MKRLFQFLLVTFFLVSLAEVAFCQSTTLGAQTESLNVFTVLKFGIGIVMIGGGAYAVLQGVSSGSEKALGTGMGLLVGGLLFSVIDKIYTLVINNVTLNNIGK